MQKPRRYVQTTISINDLPRHHRGNIPAWMIRQRLIGAGAPEGFNMADVTRHMEGTRVAFTWLEPEQPEQIITYISPERLRELATCKAGR